MTALLPRRCFVCGKALDLRGGRYYNAGTDRQHNCGQCPTCDKPVARALGQSWEPGTTTVHVCEKK